MKIENNNWKPDLFVVGFAKSGSSAFCEYLSQHPDVYVFDTKEPGTLYLEEMSPLWATGGSGEKGINQWKSIATVSLKDYKNTFSKYSKSKIKVDGTQGYSTGGVVIANRIKEFNPNAHIIFIIRNHESRLISAFNYFYKWHKQTDLNTYINKNLRPDLDSFLFYKNLRDYTNVFGKERVLVIKTEDLYSNPSQIMAIIFQRLGLSFYKVKPLSSNQRIFFTNDSPIFKRIVRSTIILLQYPPKLIVKSLKKLNLFYGNPLIGLLKPLEPSKLFSNLILKFRGKKNEFYNLPPDIEKIFKEDYARTIKYCQESKILVLNNE